MIDEIFVKQICNEYHGKTLSGFARDLQISPLTLWRVRCGNYTTDRPYARIERPNRLIANCCFTDVRETCRRIQNR